MISSNVHDLLQEHDFSAAGGDRRLVDPDLTKADPIEEVLAHLDAAAAEDLSVIYPLTFVNRLRAIGGSAMVDRSGSDDAWEDALSVGTVCDDQLDERRRRMDALIAHVRADPARRAALIDWLNRHGRFIDHRLYWSPAGAIADARTAGLRLTINDDGAPSASLPDEYRSTDDQSKGWPIRRAQQRFAASVDRPGWAKEVATLIDAARRA